MRPSGFDPAYTTTSLLGDPGGGFSPITLPPTTKYTPRLAATALRRPVSCSRIARTTLGDPATSAARPAAASIRSASMLRAIVAADLSRLSVRFAEIPDRIEEIAHAASRTTSATAKAKPTVLTGEAIQARIRPSGVCAVTADHSRVCRTVAGFRPSVIRNGRA